jgi:hypothetical protein
MLGMHVPLILKTKQHKKGGPLKSEVGDWWNCVGVDVQVNF